MLIAGDMLAGNTIDYKAKCTACQGKAYIDTGHGSMTRCDACLGRGRRLTADNTPVLKSHQEAVEAETGKPALAGVCKDCIGTGIDPFQYLLEPHQRPCKTCNGKA